MPPSKKKLLKPKEVSLDSPLKEEAPNIELPNDENKLFDVDDNVGTSTIPEVHSYQGDFLKITLQNITKIPDVA